MHKCDKRNDDKCLVGLVNFYGCGMSGQMKRDVSMMKSRGRVNAQAPASASNLDDPKKNHFYSILSQSYQESLPDVVSDMLKLFSFDVYDLWDPGATL